MNRRRWNIAFNIKDYIVPIIGLLLIILLIYSLFSGDGKEENISKENQQGIELVFSSADTKGVVSYAGWKQKEVTTDLTLYKGEKIAVSEWAISVNTPKLNFNLKKLAELAYKTDGSYWVESGNIWIDTKESVEISMKYLSLILWPDTHISLSQNEVNSTAYLISGSAEVKTEKGESTLLAPMEKIEITSKDINSESFNIKEKKSPVWDYFISSNWFIINNGSAYILEWEETASGKTEDETSGTGVLSMSSVSSGNTLLDFNNLIDESNVSAGNIIIAGSYVNPDIERIEVNGKNASLNPTKSTFLIENVDTSLQKNDLVFRIYDDSNELIEKFVYTVYYNGGKKTVVNTAANVGTATQGTNNFSVDGSQFIFTAPTSKNTYTTTGDFVTIRGKVIYEWITKVTVNGFTLNSFNGSTWRYHATKKFSTLSEGTNVYEIQYFTWEELVYKNYFTIIQKTADAVNPKQETKSGADSDLLPKDITG